LAHPKPPVVKAYRLTCSTVPELPYANSLNDARCLEGIAEAIDNPFKSVNLSPHCCQIEHLSLTPYATWLQAHLMP
jgi:hypothetical protein